MVNKLTRNLLGFVGIVTIGQLLVFHHYNALFSANAGLAKSKSTNSATSNSTNSQTAKQKQQMSVVRAKEEQALQGQGYRFITVSPAEDYITYLDSSNVLHVEDVKTRKDVSAAKNPYKVEYVSWIENPHASSTYVLVGEQIRPGDLELKTVDVSDGSQQIIAHMSGLSADAAIHKVVFSFLTNQIYILVNTKSHSAIYHIGTMKHVTQIPIGGRFIKNIAVSETNHRLYFEDRLNGSYNVLYFDDQYVPHRVHLNAALVTVVGNTLYYGKINGSGLVTSVYKLDGNGNSTLIKTLSNPTSASNIQVSNSGDIQINSSTS